VHEHTLEQVKGVVDRVHAELVFTCTRLLIPAGMLGAVAWMLWRRARRGCSWSRRSDRPGLAFSASSSAVTTVGRPARAAVAPAPSASVAAVSKTRIGRRILERPSPPARSRRCRDATPRRPSKTLIAQLRNGFASSHSGRAGLCR